MPLLFESLWQTNLHMENHNVYGKNNSKLLKYQRVTIINQYVIYHIQYLVYLQNDYDPPLFTIISHSLFILYQLFFINDG
jgi:hypothetical protein